MPILSILDHQGKPFEVEQLQEAQTARLAQLRTEYDQHPSRGLTPPKLARILQQAEQGDLTAQHELFMDMEEKDAHLFSDMQKRRMAVQQLDWSIVPPKDATPEEIKHAQFVSDTLQAMEDFGDVLFDMTDGIGHGYAALEMTWGRVDGYLVPVKIEHRPQGWFKLATNPNISRNELRLRDGTADGQPLWEHGWIMHQHRARSGYISRSGLFRILAWPFLFKNYAVRDLAEFLEIYGLPLRLGTYGTGATDKDKASLLRAVVNIGHDAAAIIPKGMEIDFKNAATGDNKSFDAMIGLMERSMSKAILGGTLTSSEGQHGTQALGNVHNEIRKDLRNGDAKQIAATLKAQLIYPLLKINKGLADPRRCPSLVFDTQEPEDLKLIADAMPKLVDMGMQITVKHAHEKLKIPMAAAGEAVLVRSVKPAAAEDEPGDPAKTGKAGTAKLKAELPTGQAEGDELDDLVAEMNSEWVEVMGDSIRPIQAALNNASSLAEFRDALEGALADANSAHLAQVLARGQFAAKAWGLVNQVKKPAA